MTKRHPELERALRLYDEAQRQLKKASEHLAACEVHADVCGEILEGTKTEELREQVNGL